MFIVEDVAQTSVTMQYEKPAVVLLKDRSIARIRPMDRADAARIVEMHTRLSADSIYSRYFHPYKPTLENIQRIYPMAQRDGAAFVANPGGSEERVIGVAHYRINQSDPGEGELGVIVVDQYQGLGLGRALLEHLVQFSRSQGVRILRAVVHPTNDRIMHLIHTGGFPYRRVYHQGMWDVYINIQGSAKGSFSKNPVLSSTG